MSATPPPRTCVRCGRNPRAGALFICAACHADDRFRIEVDEARRRSSDYEEQRRYLIAAAHWAGGWSRADERRIGARS